MIITTTHSIQNHDIVKYLGVINANQVLGVNFFSDAIAGISDVFGGNSGTYRRNLDSLYEQVIALLKQKATSIGANAIIGIQIDFDEISGKGKSMFMITAVGTAVVVSETSNISSRYSNLRMLHELRTFVNEGLLSEEEYNREKEKIDNIVTNQVEIAQRFKNMLTSGSTSRSTLHLQFISMKLLPRAFKHLHSENTLVAFLLKLAKFRSRLR